MERLQKVLSAAGVASRRTAEELILQGRVSVNGATVTTLGTKADPAADEIRVDARDSVSCTAALIALVEHALDRSDGGTRRTAPARAGSLAAHSSVEFRPAPENPAPQFPHVAPGRCRDAGATRSPLSEAAARSAAAAPRRRT